MLAAFFLTGIVLAVFLAAYGIVSFWWALPIAVGTAIGLTVAELGVTCLMSFLIRPAGEGTHIPGFLRFWVSITTGLILDCCNIRVRVSGREKLPRDRRFVLVSNHLSAFDPMVCLSRFHAGPLSFISKPENFRIPFAGPFLRACRFLKIDRENPRNAISTINEAARVVQSGEASIGIYPEGHRSPDGRLLPIKDGAFHIAKKAQAPIVVMTLTGMEKASKNAPLRRTRVKAEIHTVISEETVAQLRTQELAQRVREIMVANLPEAYQPKNRIAQ